MDSTLVDLLNPILQQYPTIGVLLAVGIYLRKFLQSCLDHQQQTVDRLLDMIEKSRSNRE